MKVAIVPTTTPNPRVQHMTYHRINRGDGREADSTREEMIGQLEEHGYYSTGSVQRMERHVRLSGLPTYVETFWAYWEIRP